MTEPAFANDREKWAWLVERTATDHTHPEIRLRAQALLRAAGGRPLVAVHLAHALARDGIRYQTDTARVGGEELGHPVEALTRGIDDCDAKARTFIALARAMNLHAELVPLWQGERLAHVSALVSLGGQKLPVETILARARVGDRYPDVPRERNGHWRFT